MLRLLLLLLLLCRGLAVMLLVNHARGSRVLQMGGDRTLLLVVGVMRVMAGLFLEMAGRLPVLSHCHQSHTMVE